MMEGTDIGNLQWCLDFELLYIIYDILETKLMNGSLPISMDFYIKYELVIL